MFFYIIYRYKTKQMNFRDHHCGRPLTTSLGLTRHTVDLFIRRDQHGLLHRPFLYY